MVAQTTTTEFIMTHQDLRPFRIISSAGANMGRWYACSAQEAIDAMHKDSGFEPDEDYVCDLSVEDLQEEYGTVDYEGLKLTLIQHAYFDHRYDVDEDCYTAIAIDHKENQYRVFWDIINNDCEDEGEACDWNVYTIMKD